MQKLSDPINRVKMLKEKMIRDDILAFGNKEYLLSFFNVEEFIKDFEYSINSDIKNKNFKTKYEAFYYWLHCEIGLRAMTEVFNEIITMIEDDLEKKYNK